MQAVPFGRSVVFSEYSGFPINKADRHDITEILWKVKLNTKNPNPYQKAERIQFFKYSIKCIINNRIVVLPDSRLSYRIIIFILIVHVTFSILKP
jgi:hypothetical protein